MVGKIEKLFFKRKRKIWEIFALSLWPSSSFFGQNYWNSGFLSVYTNATFEFCGYSEFNIRNARRGELANWAVSKRSFSSSQKNLRKKYRDFPYTACFRISIASPIVYITHQNDTFLIIDESTLAHYHHLQSIVTIVFILWVLQMPNDI